MNLKQKEALQNRINTLKAEKAQRQANIVQWNANKLLEQTRIDEINQEILDIKEGVE